MLIMTCFVFPLYIGPIVKSDTTPPLISNNLPLNYIWKWTNKLTNITYDYPLGEIARGRAFASSGGSYSASIIKRELRDNISLSPVNSEQLQYIGLRNNYSAIINVTDWGLRVNTNEAFPFSNKTLTKNEIFSMPAKNGHPIFSFYWSSTVSFDEASIEPVDFTDLSPLGGTYGNDYYQATNYNFLTNTEEFIIGKTIYLSPNDPIPSEEEQENSVFLLDDLESSQSKLDNLTIANGAIIIGSQGRGIQNVSTSQAVVPVVNLSYTSGTTVKDIVENYNLTIVDNVADDGETLTFTYNIFNGPWPDSNFVVFSRIPDHVWLWNHDQGLIKIATHGKKFMNIDKPNIGSFLLAVEMASAWWWIASTVHQDKPCEGIILADHGDYHYMLSRPRMFYNVFTVNESIGDFLETNHASATLTGYTEQEYLPETALHPIGGIGYNVYGNLSISKSPDNAKAIVSNRYDGMCGQTPGDSGVGTSTVLGMAKFFKENSIPCRYNVTFLFTTAEEYGMKGIQYFRDLHNDLNINYWFILDQLAFNQQDAALCLHACGLYNETNAVIVQEIVNETRYWNRTGYDNITLSTGDTGSEQNYITQDTRQTFCFVKDQDTRWDLWHRTGNNFHNGDCIDNTDRNDVNVTTELFWNLLKYYIVRPDCRFMSTSFEAPSTPGTIPDTLKATFKVDTVLPCDAVMVNASFIDASTDQCIAYSIFNFTTDQDGEEHNISFSLPEEKSEGDYYACLQAYNSTAIINKNTYQYLHIDYPANETINSPVFHLNRCHTLGDIRYTNNNANIQNTIRGSRFTSSENAYIYNITAYVWGVSQYPPVYPTYQCLIYRVSDGHLIAASNPEPGYATGWLTFTFPQNTVLIHDTQYYLCIWGDNSNAQIYYTPQSQGNAYLNSSYTFGTPPQTIIWAPTQGLASYAIFCRYSTNLPPQLLNMSNSPDTIGFGATETIHANITDTAGTPTAKVNITYPNHTYSNTSMTFLGGSHYRSYINTTWQTGQYNYTIWMTDGVNTNSSTQHHFHVNAQAFMRVCTLQDNYNSNIYINLTDPPNPTENYTLVARGPTWNTYYDTTTGNNVLDVYPDQVNYQPTMDGAWQPINTSFTQLPQGSLAYNKGYRIGNTQGPYSAYFKPTTQESWPVSFAYNRSQDPTTAVVRTKLASVGYIDPTSWSTHTLQTVQNSQSQTQGDTVTYPGVFTGTDVTYTYQNTQLKEAITLSNTTKTILQSHPPSQYGLGDNTYLTFVTKIDSLTLNAYDGQDPITGNLTITHGIEYKDALGHLACALPIGTAYEQHNTTANQPLTYRIIHINGDTYLLTAIPYTTLTQMTFPVIIDPTITIYSLSNDGHISNSNANYNTAWTATTGTVSSTAATLSIGQTAAAGVPPAYTIYRGMLLFNTTTLPQNANITNVILSLYKYSDTSAQDFTITVQNGQPTYPHDPLQTGDYDKSHYNGNGGGLNTTSFTDGKNDITLTNYSWIKKASETKLCLRSSRDITGSTPTANQYVTIYSGNAASQYIPKLTITYRNHSKLNNTGTTTIKGYLHIQVQYYSGGNWILDNDTVNETSSRTLKSHQQLGLDTVFNHRIKRNNLAHGNGTYRIYATFRDPYGNILVGNDQVSLVATWPFGVSGL
jgi:hypothetical protein